MSNTTVCVNVKTGMFDSGKTICFNLDEIYEDRFQPIFSTDDAMLASMTRELMPMQAEQQRRLRKDAVETLSREISKTLIEMLSDKDEHNGYRD